LHDGLLFLGFLAVISVKEAALKFDWDLVAGHGSGRVHPAALGLSRLWRWAAWHFGFELGHDVLAKSARRFGSGNGYALLLLPGKAFWTPA